MEEDEAIALTGDNAMDTEPGEEELVFSDDNEDIAHPHTSPSAAAKQPMETDNSTV
jgi:hypothetical protein